MNDEQIKQNAEAYAKEMRNKNATAYCARYFAYLAGAHSRDEEIEELKARVHFADNIINEQRNLIDQLRNPWISVNERLPEEHQDVLIENWNGLVIRNDYISIGDINYMKDNPELFPSWMPTPKSRLN